MKYLLTFILLLGITFAQFKESLDNSEQIRQSLYTEGPSGFFTNFLSSENFKMKHSVSMSYSAGGGNGVALGVYTNSMFFKLADNLKLQLDASFVNSPYNTLGEKFTNDLNGVYISNARLDYKISDKTKVVIQFRQIPNGYGYGYDYGYGYGRGYRNYGYGTFRESFDRNSFLDD